MTVAKYLKGMWSINNLIDKGNFKKQTRCLWTEGGGGTSLDSSVKQNWQQSSVNCFPISVIYFIFIYMHVYVWPCTTTRNGVKVSLLPPAYPFHHPATFTVNFHTEDFSNEFVVLKQFWLLFPVPCLSSVVKFQSKPWSDRWLILEKLFRLGVIKKIFSALLMLAVGTSSHTSCPLALMLYFPMCSVKLVRCIRILLKHIIQVYFR